MKGGVESFQGIDTKFFEFRLGPLYAQLIHLFVGHLHLFTAEPLFHTTNQNVELGEDDDYRHLTHTINVQYNRPKID